MRSKTSLALALALSFLPLWPAVAHHSLAVFARGESEIIEGTVKAFSWSNPHVQIVVMAADPDGIMRQWNFEGGSISRLANAGFNRNMMAPGDKITVTYNPRRDGAKGGFIVTVTSAAGRKYDSQRNRGPSRGGAEEG
jgi:hypothetical protein